MSPTPWTPESVELVHSESHKPDGLSESIEPVNSSTAWIIGDRNQARKKQFENAGWTIGLGKHGNLSEAKRRSWRLRLSTEKPR